MKQYSFTLLALLISAASNMAIPCQAQTANDSNINTTNNILSEKVSANDNGNQRSQVNSSGNSANSKSTVISETTEKSPSVSAKQANIRIPISSRIFASPSMQQ